MPLIFFLLIIGLFAFGFVWLFRMEKGLEDRLRKSVEALGWTYEAGAATSRATFGGVTMRPANADLCHRVSGCAAGGLKWMLEQKRDIVYGPGGDISNRPAGDPYTARWTLLDAPIHSVVFWLLDREAYDSSQSVLGKAVNKGALFLGKVFATALGAPSVEDVWTPLLSPEYLIEPLDSEFSKDYVVAAPDKEKAGKILTDAVKRALLNWKASPAMKNHGLSVRLGPPALSVEIKGYLNRVEDMRIVVDVGIGIAQAYRSK